MAWFGSAWTRRWAITVDNGVGSATGDVEIPVPADWDGWSVIRSDGADIRITTADGITLAAYALSGFSYANRTVTIQVDAVTLSGVAGMDLLWLYAGNASAAAASVAVVIAAAKAGYIELARPSTQMIDVAPEVPGTTRPRRRIQKTADEQLYVWLRLDRLLEKRAYPYQAHRQHEEIRSAVVTVTTGGAAQAGMVTGTAQRFAEVAGLRGLEMWVKAFIKAGTTGTDYTIEADLRTVVTTNTAYRQLEPRALLSVRTVSEA